MLSERDSMIESLKNKLESESNKADLIKSNELSLREKINDLEKRL